MGDSMKCATPPADTPPSPSLFNKGGLSPPGGGGRPASLPTTTHDSEMDETLDVETTTPPKSTSPPQQGGDKEPPTPLAGHLMAQLSMVAALTSQQRSLAEVKVNSLTSRLMHPTRPEIKREAEGESSNEENLAERLVKAEPVSSSTSGNGNGGKSKSVQNNNTNSYSEGFAGGRLKFFKGRNF